MTIGVGSVDVAQASSATTAYYFAFDKTRAVAVERGARSPRTTRWCATRFAGPIERVRLDLAPDVRPGPGVRRRVLMLIND